MLASTTLDYSCQGPTWPPVGWHQSEVPPDLQPAVLGPGPAHQQAGWHHARQIPAVNWLPESRQAYQHAHGS